MKSRTFHDRTQIRRSWRVATPSLFKAQKLSSNLQILRANINDSYVIFSPLLPNFLFFFFSAALSHSCECLACRCEPLCPARQFLRALKQYRLRTQQCRGFVTKFQPHHTCLTLSVLIYSLTIKIELWLLERRKGDSCSKLLCLQRGIRAMSIVQGD